MKAAVNERYGAPDVLKIRDVPTPKPGPGQVRIKVHTTTVGRTDACALRAHPFFMRISSGLIRPKRAVLGFDFAGTVDEVGEGVTRFSPGDRVFGLTADGYGAHAEYLCLPEDGAVCTIPAGIHFDEVVICEGAWYTNSNLRQLELGPGHNILIYRASGAIGSSAVQLAKFYGAEETAAVSTAHLELVKHLGADHAVDYTTEDFTQIGESFDFVLDAVGKTTFFHCRSLLKPDGVFATTDLGPGGRIRQANAFHEASRSRAKDLRITTATEGAGAHCQLDNFPLARQIVFDWIEHRMRKGNQRIKGTSP